MQRAMQFTCIQKGRQAVALMFDRRPPDCRKFNTTCQTFGFLDVLDNEDFLTEVSGDTWREFILG